MSRTIKSQRYNNLGFTLLETMVALSLFAVIGGMLLSWLNTNLTAISRIEAAESRIHVLQNAREYLALKNPGIEPQGEILLGEHKVMWSSHPLTKATPVISNHAGREGSFKAQLFKTTVTIQGTTEPDYVFVIEQIGYRQYRDFTGTQ